MVSVHRPNVFSGSLNINVDVAFMRTPVWLINLCCSEGKDDKVTGVSSKFKQFIV